MCEKLYETRRELGSGFGAKCAKHSFSRSCTCSKYPCRCCDADSTSRKRSWILILSSRLPDTRKMLSHGVKHPVAQTWTTEAATPNLHVTVIIEISRHVVNLPNKESNLDKCIACSRFYPSQMCGQKCRSVWYNQDKFTLAFFLLCISPPRATLDDDKLVERAVGREKPEKKTIGRSVCALMSCPRAVKKKTCKSYASNNVDCVGGLCWWIHNPCWSMIWCLLCTLKQIIEMSVELTHTPSTRMGDQQSIPCWSCAQTSEHTAHGPHGMQVRVIIKWRQFRGAENDGSAHVVQMQKVWLLFKEKTGHQVAREC